MFDFLPQLIDLKELKESGILQEINRRFLHILGLELVIEEMPVTQEYSLAGILDLRHKTGGIVRDYSDRSCSLKARIFQEDFNKRAKARYDIYGFVVQPVNTLLPISKIELWATVKTERVPTSDGDDAYEFEVIMGVYPDKMSAVAAVKTHGVYIVPISL